MGRALAWCLCLVLIGLSAGTGIRYFHEPPWCELSGGGVALADLLSYGRPPEQPWAGPHSTIKTALIEWITNGTFDHAPSARSTSTPAA
jgi:hypothetical protein